MSNEVNLTNHFLIAMPALQDPNFYHTVTYICEHNAEGAMGIIINRPLELSINELFEQLEIPTEDPAGKQQHVYLGGPVQPDRGFVLHRTGQPWDSTLQVTEDVSITASQDILRAMAAGEGPEDALIALGYAGWGEGQIEQELADNAWLSGPADTDIIFHMAAHQRWDAAAGLLGIDLNLLSGEAGHA